MDRQHGGQGAARPTGPRGSEGTGPEIRPVAPTRPKQGIAASLEVILKRGVRVLNGIGLLSLVALALVTVADVVGRYLFNRPLLGALELSEVMMVFLVFGGLAFTELQDGHVEVDVLVNGFSPRWRALCEAFAALLSTGLWSTIAWRTALQAAKVHTMGEITATLLLPVAPFIWTAAVGSASFALVLLIRMLRAFRRVVAP